MVYLQGRGANPEEHVRLGYLPKLTSYQADDLLELTPALLHDIISLGALQVPARPTCILPLHAGLAEDIHRPLSAGAGTFGVYLLQIYRGECCHSEQLSEQ